MAVLLPGLQGHQCQDFAAVYCALRMHPNLRWSAARSSQQHQHDVCTRRVHTPNDPVLHFCSSPHQLPIQHNQKKIIGTAEKSNANQAGTVESWQCSTVKLKASPVQQFYTSELPYNHLKATERWPLNRQVPEARKVHFLLLVEQQWGPRRCRIVQ